MLLVEFRGASLLEVALAHHKSKWKAWIRVDWLMPELVTNMYPVIVMFLCVRFVWLGSRSFIDQSAMCVADKVNRICFHLQI